MNLVKIVSTKLGKISQSSNYWKHNPWVLGWLTLLSGVFLVNLFLVFKAVTTNPGLVVKDYYDQGRAHEQNVLQKIAARKALQWDIQPDFVGSFVVNTTMKYGISIKDIHGLPVDKAKVDVLAYRPADAKADFSLPLIEIEPGHYQGALTLPLKGAWELIVNIERGKDKSDLTQRINVLQQ